MPSPYSYQSGAGGGSSAATSGSGKNYLATVNNINGNGDFELGTTTKWGLGVTGALTNGLPTTTPTFGSGASGNLSIAASNSSPLAGSWSLNYVSSAATTVGNCLASDAFTIDQEDQAKVMTVKFYYQVTVNASNANWSGTSSNSYAWAVYDVTNSSWIIPAGAFGMTQSTGVGYCTGTFQTSSNSTSYRIVVYNANATSGAVTVKFDDFFLGPQTAPFGPVATDWQSYTPVVTATGTAAAFGTIVRNNMWYRRVGDSLEMHWDFKQSAAGTAGTGAYTINLPTGLVIDTSKRNVVSASGEGLLGDAYWYNSNIAQRFTGQAVIFSSTALTFVFTNPTGAAGTLLDWGATDLPLNFTSTTSISANIEALPITGWSSNLQMSNDTDTRVVAFTGHLASTYVVGANAVIKWDTTDYDTHAGYSASTGLYTIPVSGIYRVSVTQDIAVANAAYYISKSGSAKQYLTFAPGSGTVAGGSGEISCVAGDTLSVFSNTAGTVQGGAAPYVSSISISRLSGPSVIASTETVAARYGDSATSVSTSATTVVYSTKSYDTHNAYNTSTGIYTIPVSGTYRFTTKIASAAQTTATNAVAVSLAIRKNSTTMDTTYVIGSGGAGLNYTHGLTAEFACLAGDTIDVRAFFSSAATPVGGVSSNNFTAARIGN